MVYTDLTLVCLCVLLFWRCGILSSTFPELYILYKWCLGFRCKGQTFHVDVGPGVDQHLSPALTLHSLLSELHLLYEWCLGFRCKGQTFHGDIGPGVYQHLSPALALQPLIPELYLLYKWGLGLSCKGQTFHVNVGPSVNQHLGHLGRVGQDCLIEWRTTCGLQKYMCNNRCQPWIFTLLVFSAAINIS